MPTYDVMAPFHERAARDEALARLRRDDPVHRDDANRWCLHDFLGSLGEAGGRRRW